MELKLDSRFKKRVAGMFGKYEFEVGVLDDAPYRKPARGKPGLEGNDIISSFAGGPVRKKSRELSGLMISDVSKANRDRIGFNYLTKPFDGQGESRDIINFSNAFFNLVFGRGQKKRAENLLQAIVRNPILRGENGTNSFLTVIIKGFDRPMMDTGQLFKAIKAVCRVRNV